MPVCAPGQADSSSVDVGGGKEVSHKEYMQNKISQCLKEEAPVGPPPPAMPTSPGQAMPPRGRSPSAHVGVTCIYVG